MVHLQPNAAMSQQSYSAPQSTVHLSCTALTVYNNIKAALKLCFQLLGLNSSNFWQRMSTVRISFENGMQTSSCKISEISTSLYHRVRDPKGPKPSVCYLNGQ